VSLCSEVVVYTECYVNVFRNGPRPHPDRCIIDAYFRGQWLTLNELNSRTFGRAAVPRVTVQARPMEVYARFLNNISLLVNRMNIERVIHTASGEWWVFHWPPPLFPFSFFLCPLSLLSSYSSSHCVIQYSSSLTRTLSRFILYAAGCPFLCSHISISELYFCISRTIHSLPYSRGNMIFPHASNYSTTPDRC
jgi:hypothetical protein